MAMAIQADPDGMSARGLRWENFESEFRRNIESYVDSEYRGLFGLFGSNQWIIEMAKACALGNPAACEQ